MFSSYVLLEEWVCWKIALFDFGMLVINLAINVFLLFVRRKPIPNFFDGSTYLKKIIYMITCVPCKLLEHIVCSNIMAHLDESYT